MRNRTAFTILILFCIIFNDASAQRFQIHEAGMWLRVKMINPISIITKLPIKSDKNTVFVFLSPECPLSRNYIPELNRIRDTYKNCELIGVFPGKSYSVKEIRTFIKDYKITFTAVIDEKKRLTQLLKGTVTPQVVLLDKKGNMVYSGLVDDKIIELGQQRQVVSKHFLTDAIESLEMNKKITISNTKPIGCYINDL
jgi:thioredoxin-related protein